MNDKYIAQAPTQEEAIIKGLNALGITKDEAVIKVEEPGKKGFLGIGQKDAVVIVERKEKMNVVDEFLSNEFDMDRTEENEPASSSEAEKETKTEATASQTDTSIEEKEEEAKEQEAEMSVEEMDAGREPAEEIGRAHV